MKIKLGRGWAPEQPIDDIELFAIRELQALLTRLFNSPKSLMLTKRNDLI